MSSQDIPIVALDAISTASVRQFGGKAANLGELTRSGVSIPSGLAIGRDVLASFLRENGVDLAAVERVHTLGMTFLESVLVEAQSLQKHIVEVIARAPFPPALERTLLERLGNLLKRPVAVRSSCIVEDAKTTSFAGQYATILNVVGGPQILDALRACWASQYNGRALAYAMARRGMPVLSPCMGVLIQEMLAPDYAGVCFTVGPTQRTKDYAIVESVHGCGEALVSGEKTPWHFEVSRERNIHKAVGPRFESAMRPSDATILAVVDAAVLVESHFGTSQDVEWAVVDDHVYILQARPITVSGTPKKGIPIGLPSAKSAFQIQQLDASPTGEAPQISLRDDLHEWLLTQSDPLIYRGASFVLSAQRADGSWRVDKHPEWDHVTTALMIQLLIEGGIPPTLRWTVPGELGRPMAIGLPLALSWLAESVNADGTWGSDLWDTCQAIRAFVKAGVSPRNPIVARAVKFLETEIERGFDRCAGQEWSGAGFLALALRLCSEAEMKDLSSKCLDSLLISQEATGHFLGPVVKEQRSRVPSEWHTTQAISALSQCADLKRREVAIAIDKGCGWLVSRQMPNGSWGVQDPPYCLFNALFTAYSVIALANARLKEHADAIARAQKWLRGQQLASGAFGDMGSSLMAMAAFQAINGPMFTLEIPIPMFLRIQMTLSSNPADTMAEGTPL